MQTIAIYIAYKTATTWLTTLLSSGALWRNDGEYLFISGQLVFSASHL